MPAFQTEHEFWRGLDATPAGAACPPDRDKKHGLCSAPVSIDLTTNGPWRPLIGEKRAPLRRGQPGRVWLLWDDAPLAFWVKSFLVPSDVEVPVVVEVAGKVGGA